MVTSRCFKAFDSAMANGFLSSNNRSACSWVNFLSSKDIKTKAIQAAKDETLDAGFWISLFSPFIPFALGQADVDDYVGAGYQIVSFGELLEKNAVPVNLRCSNSKDWEGSYTVKGWIRRR